MAWSGFWSPHAADFLNWRYLDDPCDSHLALAVCEGDDVEGYCVVRTRGSRALLMEFVAPPREAAVLALLGAARRAAATAGCQRLGFFATPLWPHWRTFESAGFVDRPGSRSFMVIASRAPATRWCWSAGNSSPAIRTHLDPTAGISRESS